MPVLEKEGLLSKVENQKSRQISHHIDHDLITPHQITRHLWWWLIEHHLESKQLVEWVIEKGTLHPLFIRFLEQKLSNNPPSEPFLTFWRIIASNINSCIFSEPYHEINKLQRSRDSLNLLSLSKFIEPKIKFSKYFSWDDKEESVPYEAEVFIGINDWQFKQILKYVNDMATLLLPITNTLKQTIELWQLLGKADTKHDHSNWYLKSISPHAQNHRHRNWVFLIELCRDLWQATYQTNKALALAIVELWKTIDFPVFKRLVFYAYATFDIASPSEKLNYLLSNENWWLWSAETKRETFRLLASFVTQLTKDELSILEQAIIAGAPREMYKDDLTNERWQEISERNIWLYLAKLESFDVDLTEQSKTVYNDLSAKHPYWQLQEDERDEFSSWMSSVRRGGQCDLTMDSFIKLTPEQRIEALLTPPSNDHFEQNQTSFFNSVCQDKPSIGLETLKYMAGQSNWNADIWHAGLMGLSETKVQWSEVAKLIVQFPNALFQEQAWVIAWWVNKTISSIAADSEDEQYFWRIFDLLISQTQPKDIDSETERDINYAINHPIGILTEALLNRFSIRKIKVMDKITDIKLLNCVDKLVISDDAVLLPAKIILISRLHYFYAIDPDWTNTNLMPLLNWKKSTNAALYWDGFILSSRVPNELALAIKNDFLDTLLNHRTELDKQCLDNSTQLFADICFAYQTLYTVNEQRQVLNSVGAEGLIKISEFMLHIMGKDKKENDQYWIKRIKPFFQKIWLRDAASLSSKISENLALMCVALDEEFEDAVKTIEIIFTPFKDISFFLSQLEKSEHIAKHPVITFELLANVFDSNMEHWYIGKFKEVFDELVAQEPSLKNHKKFQEMNHVLVKACS